MFPFSPLPLRSGNNRGLSKIVAKPSGISNPPQLFFNDWQRHSGGETRSRRLACP